VKVASSGHMEHHLLSSTSAPPTSSPSSRAVMPCCHFGLSQTRGLCSVGESWRMVWKGQEKMRTLCPVKSYQHYSREIEGRWKVEERMETYFKRTSNTHPRPLSRLLPILSGIRKPGTNLLKPLSMLKPISLHRFGTAMIRQSIEPKERTLAPIAGMVPHRVRDVIELDRVAERGFPQDVTVSFFEGPPALFVA
jgi:hypothetical protein